MNAPLPTVYTALLDADHLHCVLDDIGMVASEIDIRVRQGPSDAGEYGLVEARRALVSGRARAVQIRYVHAGEPWCDTFTRSPEGIRLHRIRRDHDQQES